MGHTFLLALDAGGGGGHAVVVDADDGTVTRAFRPWRHAVAPDTSGLGFDFDLEGAWRLLADAAAEALARAGAAPRDVAGIAATSMRHTTVVLDDAGAALLATPNRDGRAIAEAFALLA
ncbi:MAG TPA: autoinducer-2 kinase, partial [Actinomycetota bacterium]